MSMFSSILDQTGVEKRDNPDSADEPVIVVFTSPQDLLDRLAELRAMSDGVYTLDFGPSFDARDRTIWSQTFYLVGKREQ
jgi:hypothetical protein